MTGYELAKTMKGKHENRNTKELNDFIAKYFPIWGREHLSVATTAWCAAIMNAWEVASGSGTGSGAYNARSFLNYGSSVYDRDKKIGRVQDAKQGDIAVFERGGSTWQGHVAYIDGVEESENGILIRTLGGNQSDAITIGWYPIKRLLGIRRSFGMIKVDPFLGENNE